LGFSMKEASECLGLASHTIRYYEKEGLLPSIERDQYGNRIFEQKDLDWMQLMSCFRATGMTIASLKRMVDLAVQGDATITERKMILETHKLELNKKQVELDRAFEAVNQNLTIYESMMNKDEIIETNGVEFC
jgi:DNA-binding transcriptional MerR regulator